MCRHLWDGQLGDYRLRDGRDWDSLYQMVSSGLDQMVRRFGYQMAADTDRDRSVYRGTTDG